MSCKIRKILGRLALLVCYCSLLMGCASENRQALHSWMQQNGKIKVLCTIGMIKDLVARIGGDYLDTLTLVTGNLNPHAYQLVKGDSEKLSYADIIFYNGLGLEHGPSLHEYLESSEKAIALGSLLQREEPSLFLFYNGGLGQKSVDPHIWMDCSLWAKTIPAIVETLAKRDPAHADVFRANGQQLVKTLLDKHRQFREQMHTIPEAKRYLITSHDAFNYFTRAYLSTDEEIKNGDWQKRFAAPEGLAPDSQLSTTDIQLIIDHMQRYRIRVIFPESNVSQASIRKLLDVGEELGMPIHIANDTLYGDAMGPPGSSGDTYVKMIQHNIETIMKYLTKNGAASSPERKNENANGR